jgi:hypothetical protein
MWLARENIFKDTKIYCKSKEHKSSDRLKLFLVDK